MIKIYIQILNYICFDFSQQFGNKFKDMENQNTILNNQNKSINGKYDEILIENQALIDELNMIKTSL